MGSLDWNWCIPYAQPRKKTMCNICILRRDLEQKLQIQACFWPAGPIFSTCSTVWRPVEQEKLHFQVHNAILCALESDQVYIFVH